MITPNTIFPFTATYPDPSDLGGQLGAQQRGSQQENERRAFKNETCNVAGPFGCKDGFGRYVAMGHSNPVYAAFRTDGTKQNRQ